MAELDVLPYWDEVEVPSFPALDRSLDVDVVVIGGGLTGITAACLLTEAGRRVALVERGRMGGVDTGCTTAHLTSVTDARLDELVSSVGRDHAQAVWDAGFAAIHQIEQTADRLGIACDFSWVPGYLHAPFDADADAQAREGKRLRHEALLARELDFDAEYLERTPIVGGPSLQVDHQATFHPRKYLRGLLTYLTGSGALLFEQTEAAVSEDGVTGGPHRVRAPWTIVATHNPGVGREGFLRASLRQTTLSLYTSYVVRARLAQRLDEALYWDTSSPYRYVRIDRVDGETFAIAGGEDHKTGQIDDTTAPFRTLEAWVSRLFPGSTVTHRWSGQVIETADLLPVIGPAAERQFIATGFAGNGMTFGTLAAMMARDAVTGASNPWKELFDANRTGIARGAWRYLTENVDYPYYLIRDRFAGAPSRPLRALKRHEGGVFTVEGEVIAAYRDEQGRLHTLSATCPHLGCQVHWNQVERTWDCPCHGSRFRPTGDVIAGPAAAPLAPSAVGDRQRGGAGTSASNQQS